MAVTSRVSLLWRNRTTRDFPFGTADSLAPRRSKAGLAPVHSCPLQWNENSGAAPVVTRSMPVERSANCWVTSPDFESKLRVLFTRSLPMVQCRPPSWIASPSLRSKAESNRMHTDPDAINVPFLSNSLLVLTLCPTFLCLDIAAILEFLCRSSTLHANLSDEP